MVNVWALKYKGVTLGYRFQHLKEDSSIEATYDMSVKDAFVYSKDMKREEATNCGVLNVRLEGEVVYSDLEDGVQELVL